jgi:RNase P/RNase MRP subunit p30
MITTRNIEEAKRMISKSTKPIIVLAQDRVFNRKMLEYGKFDVLMSPEREETEESLKQTNSGLNEVLARIAKKNNIAIGIDLEEIKNTKEKYLRIKQIIQNITLCRTIGVKLYVKGKGAKEVLLSLGASTKQAHEATQYF